MHQEADLPLLDLLKDDTVPYETIKNHIKQYYCGNLNTTLKKDRYEGTIFWWAVYLKNYKIASSMIDEDSTNPIAVNESSKVSYVPNILKQENCQRPTPLWLAIENNAKNLIIKILEKCTDLEINNIIITQTKCGPILGFLIANEKWELVDFVLEKFPEVDIYKPFIKSFDEAFTFPEKQQESVLQMLYYSKVENSISSLIQMLRYNKNLKNNIIEEIILNKQKSLTILDILTQLKNNPYLSTIPVQSFSSFKEENICIVYTHMDIIKDNYASFTPMLAELYYKSAEYGFQLAKSWVQKIQEGKNLKYTNSDEIITLYFTNAEIYAGMAEQGGYKDAGYLLKQIQEECDQYIEKIKVNFENSFAFLPLTNNDQPENITASATQSINKENKP